MVMGILHSVGVRPLIFQHTLFSHVNDISISYFLTKKISSIFRKNVWKLLDFTLQQFLGIIEVFFLKHHLTGKSRWSLVFCSHFTFLPRNKKVK